MIANKIKPKIERVINKFPTEVIIYRGTKNEFGEPGETVKVCDITGFYHEGNYQIKVIRNDGGTYKSDKGTFLMVLYDDKSKTIEEGDCLFLDNIKYEIKDKGNMNRLNIYFDMKIERC